MATIQAKEIGNKLAVTNVVLQSFLDAVHYVVAVTDLIYFEQNMYCKTNVDQARHFAYLPA